jgi:hypothetical protein
MAPAADDRVCNEFATTTAMMIESLDALLDRIANRANTDGSSAQRSLNCDGISTVSPIRER